MPKLSGQSAEPEPSPPVAPFTPDAGTIIVIVKTNAVNIENILFLFILISPFLRLL